MTCDSDGWKVDQPPARVLDDATPIPEHDPFLTEHLEVVQAAARHDADQAQPLLKRAPALQRFEFFDSDRRAQSLDRFAVIKAPDPPSSKLRRHQVSIPLPSARCACMLICL